MKRIQQTFLICFFFLDALSGSTFFSDAFATVTTSLCSRREIVATELRCQKPGQSSFDASDLSRRSLLKLAFVLPIATTTPFCSSMAVASDVDPFAAMDDILSSGTATASGFSFSVPGNDSSTQQTTGSGSSDAKASSTSASPASPNSDMAAALEESSKKRRIDPRTHG